MKLTKAQKVKLFVNLVRSYHYDKMMYRRLMQGKLIGFYHPAGGAIAPGVGACSFLNKDDNLNPHHRGHGITHIISKGIDVKTFLAEHTGKETGCFKGRSAWHFHYPDDKVYQQSGFIGHNFAPSVGWGWAAKRRGQNQVVMNCSGDGSYGEGRAHEALLMAQNWKLPIIFFCENNDMAIFSRSSEMHPTEHISSLAQGYGMDSVIVDGQDVFAVAEVVIDAIKKARQGDGPVFIEAKTMRYQEHDIGTPDLGGWEARSDAEHKKMREREPVNLATEQLLKDKILTRKKIDEIHASALEEIADVETYADSCEIARPTEEELLADIFVD
jgi:TPP-dependent pyruvate/acetoin dehydrogenase alpha subunit